MLKKLLASALAVATVASCAYVPTALASAATTYTEATALKYDLYQLEHPTSETENPKVTVYVAGDQTTTVSDLEVADTSVETVKAALVKQLADGVEDVKFENGKATTEEGYLVRYTLGELVQASNTNSFVVTVTKETAVEYALADKYANVELKYVAEEDLSNKQVKLLGWFTGELTAVKNAAITQMWKDNMAAQVKIAGFAFAADWQWKSGLIVPALREVNIDEYGYEKVNAVTILNGLSEEIDGSKLVYGIYANDAKVDITEIISVNTTVPVSVTSTTERAQYIWNRYIYEYSAKAVTNGTTGYTASGFRYVGAVKNDSVELSKAYAMVFTKNTDSSTEAKITYTIKVTILDSYDDVNDKLKNDVATIDNLECADVPVSAGYTHDVAAAYALIAKYNSSVTAADLAAWCDAQDDVDIYQYEVADVTQYDISTDPTNRKVEISVNVARKTKTPVYYFKDGVISQKDAYLTAAQLANVKKYGNEGLLGTAETTVMRTTADDLGIDNAAVTDLGNSTFAYAKSIADGEWVEVTYVVDAVQATMDDFQTATGAFQVEPYFCRSNAYVGDKVMLKVALTDAGKAKELDINKVTVKYDLVGATAGANYHFTPAAGDTRPEGIATDITLGEGTNIAIANVYYDGALIGTFAPFYTVAIAK